MSFVSDSDQMESSSVNIVDLAGGIAIAPNDATENDYAWLDYIEEDNCFMPLALDDSQPSKTLDFGCDGYTGSLSTWHELMQITAPDAQCGLVFVRGDFPDHPDAILARAQRRNQRGTFGMTIRIPEKQEWAQEPTAAQGLVNLRWPYTRFNWVREGEAGVPFATFTVCSFVEDGTLYQIARIVPRMLARPSPAASSVNLADRLSTTKKSIEFEVDVGGLVRFGCPSTIGSANCSTTPTDEVSQVFEDVYPTSIETPEIPETAKNPKDVATVYTCTSTHHKKRLEIRLWIDRVPQNPSEFRHGCDVTHPKEVASVHIRKKVDFDSKKVTAIVAAFRLVDSGAELKPMASVGYDKVMVHLGVADKSPHAPYRLWSALLGSSSSADSFELNTVARSVEAILGVASLPVASSKTGWPASIALLRNIITPQVVDLESAFWQVRLLITAAEKMKDKLQWASLSHVRGLEPHYELMQNDYREKIVNHIRGFCTWLLDLFDSVRDFDKPSPQIRDPGVGILPSDIHPNHKRQCRPDSGSQSPLIGDQKYYGAIIISYVLRRLPEVFNESDIQGELWKKASSLFGVQTCYKSSTSTKNELSVAMDDPYGGIIRWYHNHSLLHICQWLQEKHVDEFKKDTPKYLLSLLYPPSSQIREPNESSSSQSAQESSRPSGNTAAAEDEQPPEAVTATMASSPDSSPSLIGNQQARPDARSDNANQVPDSQKNTEVRPRTLGVIKTRMDDWQAKAEKAMRLFEQGRLRGRELGHKTANLANIGEELGIEPTAITLSGVSCLSLSRSLIKRRKATKKLSAGRAHIMRWDPQHNIRSAKPRPAPWELSCLAQYLPYVLGVCDFQKDNCLERIRMFMFSDYSFMGSWDPSKKTIVDEWWDHITTCIVSAKLLEDSMSRGQKQRNTSPQLATASDSTDALRREGLDLLRDMHELQKRTYAKTDLVFQWQLLRPKQLYHADSSVLSVEDTRSIQKMYQRPDADVLATRLNLHRYFDYYVLPGPVDTLRIIESNIGASKLHNLSCLDIVLVTDCNDHPETSRPIIRGGAESGFWDEWVKGDVRRGKLQELFVNTEAGGLKDLYLIGKPDAHPFYKKNQDVLADKTIRGDFLEKYSKRLFTRLNDCLVDQKVKCRVLFAKRFSPITLQAIVCMWHPEAIDTFDVHLGELSSFRDIIDQSITGSDNTWISSITIKHWRLLGDAETMVRKAEKDVDEDQRIARWDYKYPLEDKNARWLFYRRRMDPRMEKPTPKNGDGTTTAKPIAEHDKDCDFPPPGVPDDREGSPVLLWNMHELNKIHELSVSMVITGDVMGRGWTCSIICELFDEKDVINYTKQASYILQMFIHQQNSARALVFLMLLGNICLALAKECGKFTDELHGVMKLNSQVLLNGLEWEKSDRALKKLKQMLWGYESLRGCSDMLKRAIDEIGKARDKMNKRLGEGSAIRHEEMKSAALQIQEGFEKKFSLLEAASHGVQQRVEQGDKLREGITSVLGVEQNENISMLTWLTIIYLGPSLVVGLFGMSNNAILNDNSSATFYRLLGGLLGGTLLFALCLSTIITIVRLFWRQVTRPVKRVWERGQHHIRDKVTFWWKYRKFLFWAWLWGASREQQRAAKRDEDVETSPVGRDDGVAAVASQRTTRAYHYCRSEWTCCGREDLAGLSLLLEHGSDPNLDIGICPPPLYAALATETDMAQKLLDHGANPNKIFANPNKIFANTTPLIMAVSQKDLVKTRQLLNVGADPNKSPPGSDLLPLSIAANQFMVISETTDWQLAVAFIRLLVVEFRARPDADVSDGKTPLLLAAMAEEDHVEDALTVATILLNARADPNAKDVASGCSVLHCAQSREMCWLLMARGANPRVRNNAGYLAPTVKRWAPDAVRDLELARIRRERMAGMYGPTWRPGGGGGGGGQGGGSGWSRFFR